MATLPAVTYRSAVPDHDVALRRPPDTDWAMGARPGPRTASIRDTVAALLEIGLPMTAKGPLIRRRPVVALAERLELDTMALRRAQRLRRKYGPGPVMLRLPLRRMAILLEPKDVHRVLHGEPEPFAVSTAEKRMGLPHFEPNISLISDGLDRLDRRGFSEFVLQTHEPVHRLAPEMLRVLDQEAQQIVTEATAAGSLDWYTFTERWFRMVRRIVLGDGAADDQKLGQMLDALRHLANMSFLVPRLAPLRERYHERLQGHIDRAEPGTLAQLIREAPVTDRTEPSDQVTQWLFAFDPAAMATYRTLALLAAHPDERRIALAEADALRGARRGELRYLRACVLESLRLWPTTPLILRETRQETHWGSGTIPTDTTLIIFAPLFHRDDRRVRRAHRFQPELFMDESKQRDWPLVPFSGGPGICPGQNLVLFLASSMLATLLTRLELKLEDPDRMSPDADLPGILDHYTVRLTAQARRQPAWPAADLSRAAG
jgi:cytochrome P450